MKKFASLLLALLMVVSMVPAVHAESSDKPVFWFSNGSWCLNGGPDEMPMWDTIEQITGTDVEWINIDGAVWGQQVSLAVSTGMDLPDVFWHGIGSDIISQNLDQDVFLPTEDLIEKYMPNLSAILAANPDFAALCTFSDGHMYGFPYIEALDYGTCFPGPFYVNQDWLDKLDLDVPTTVEEFTDVLRAFKNGGDLNGNGLDDEVPYAVNFTGNGDAFSSQNTFFAFLGCFGEAGSYGQNYSMTKIKDDEVFFVANTEAFKETLKYFNMLYNEGLLDINGFASGDVTPHVTTTEPTAGALGIWDIYAYAGYESYTALPRLYGEKGMSGYGLNRSELNTIGVGVITTECENVEAVCRLIDLCYDPVMSCYINWGAAFYLTDEAQVVPQYIKDEANTTLGKPAMTEVRVGTEYDEIDGGYYRWSSTPGPGPCAVLSEYYGTIYGFSQANNWNLVDQVTNGKYEVRAEYTAAPSYTLSDDDALSYSMLWPAIENIVKSYMVSSIMDGNVDATWDKYLKDLEANGLEDMLYCLNNSYASYNEVKQEYLTKASAYEKNPVEALIENAKQRILNMPNSMAVYADLVWGK